MRLHVDWVVQETGGMRLDWVRTVGNEARLDEDWGMRLDWVRTGE